MIKNMKIKYDKKTIKILTVVGIISAIVLGLGVLLIWLEITGTELLTLVALYEGSAVSIFCLAAVISGELYFRRLKAYGYEVPERKKDYGGMLENLPRNEVQGKSLFSNWSRWCMYASLYAYIVFMLLNVVRLIKWSFMWENSKATFFLCSIFYVSWIIMAIILRSQSNKEKYRDDVELDVERKLRWSPEKTLFSVIILVLISMFANSTGNSMIDYVFRSTLASDRDNAYMIGEATLLAIDEYQQKNSTTSDESYKLLCEGVNIISFGEPTDELQQSLAEHLYISDFSQLEQKFRLADGEAQVEVHYDGESVAVKLLNPVIELEKYGRNYKEISVETSKSNLQHK